MNQAIVPFHRPSIGDEEIREVSDVLRSGWLTTGPKTAQFETEFREYVNAAHAVALNSATAGLHLAQLALEIGPGDEVITTPLTFCATVNTIIQVGAMPVLADVDDDGNLDPDAITASITPRTRAIVPVHLAGLPCRMDSIWEIARRNGLKVIEDAAHATGAHFRGLPVGSTSPSDAIIFSFYATKGLTTGEGGMLTTPSEALAARVRLLSLHGISKDAWNRYDDRGAWYYEVEACGFKYNITDIQSAIGIHQLRKQETFLSTRTRYAQKYNAAFAELDEVDVPPVRADSRHAWHLYQLRLNPDRLSITRDQFISELRRRGVVASVHFIPVPIHPYFAQYAQLQHNQCPRAMQLYMRTVSLPLYPGMHEAQVQYVIDCVKAIVQAYRRTSVVSNYSGA